MLRHPFITGYSSLTATPGENTDQMLRFETNIDPGMFEINIDDEIPYDNSC